MAETTGLLHERRRGPGRPPKQKEKRNVGRRALAAPAGGVWPCPKDGCSSAFTRHANLNRHLREHAHEGKRHSPHVCRHPGCGKKFTRADALQTHSETVHELPLLGVQRAAAEVAAEDARRAAAAESAARVAAEEAQHAAEAEVATLAEAARAAQLLVADLRARLDDAVARSAQLEARLAARRANGSGETHDPARRLEPDADDEESM